MEVSISGRHCVIPENTRQDISDRINAIFEPLTLKVISAKVVMEMQESRVSIDIVVHIKDQTFETHVEGYQFAAVIDEAIAKIDTQATKYIEKKQNHR